MHLKKFKSWQKELEAEIHVCYYLSIRDQRASKERKRVNGTKIGEESASLRISKDFEQHSSFYSLPY